MASRLTKTYKTIFVVQAFDKIVQDNLEDIVVLELYAKDVDDALKKARKYIKRKKYRVARIIEK